MGGRKNNKSSQTRQTGGGCIYDRHRKMCRRMPMIPDIAPECIQENGRCLVKEEEGEREVVLPTTTKPTGLQYISGPVSMTSFHFEGRRFTFLGDLHQSKEGTCPEIYPNKVKSCSFSTPQKDHDISDQCYDLTYLLKDLFKRAKTENAYVDFFLEVPFQSKEVGQSVEELTRKLRQIKMTQGKLPMWEPPDYIRSLLNLFAECFQAKKEQCPYSPNVRFHYVDIRQIRNLKWGGFISLPTYIFMKRLDKDMGTLETLLQIRKTGATPNMFESLPQITGAQNLWSKVATSFRQC